MLPRWALALVLLATSCSKDTSILLTVGGDLEPGIEVNGLEIALYERGAQLSSTTHRLSAADDLPKAFTIVPPPGSPSVVDLVVSATLDRGTVVEATRAVSLVPEQQVEVRVCLLRQCIDVDDGPCLGGPCDLAPADADADADADLDASEDGEPDGDADADLDADMDAARDGDDIVERDADWTECEDFTIEVTSGCSRLEEHLTETYFEVGVEPLLHIVGAYEGESGRINVHVDRTQRPVVLALSAYDAVEFVLDLAPGADVASILVYGPQDQTVVGASGVDVIDRSGDRFSSYACDCWPACESSPTDAAAVAEDAEIQTGAKIASFHGCYGLGDITLGHDCAPSCDSACIGRTCGPVDRCGLSCGICDEGFVCGATGRCHDTSFLRGCEAPALEPFFCLTRVAGDPYVIGLTSGTLCPLDTPPDWRTPSSDDEFEIDGQSIAWVGDHLYMCTDIRNAHGLARISLIDGSWEVAPFLCDGVASTSGGSWPTSEGLWVLEDRSSSRNIVAFSSFDDALDGRGAVSSISPETTFTVFGDRLYAAARSTSTIQVFDLATLEPLPSVTLDRHVGDVRALSVTFLGDLYVHDGAGDRIAVFDLATGDWVRDVALGLEIEGLVCVSSE